MSENDMARSQSEPGSREPSQQAVSAFGFDPSRGPTGAASGGSSDLLATDLPNKVSDAIMGLEWANRGLYVGYNSHEEEAKRRHASIQHIVAHLIEATALGTGAQDEQDDLNGAPRKAPLVLTDYEVAELAASERISAAQVAYDEALQDYDSTEPEHEVRLFDAMKEAIAVADHYRNAPAAPRSRSGVSVEEIAGEAGFLLDRLRDFENEHLTDEASRDYYGHVMPPIERLTAILVLIAQAARDDDAP